MKSALWYATQGHVNEMMADFRKHCGRYSGDYGCFCHHMENETMCCPPGENFKLCPFWVEQTGGAWSLPKRSESTIYDTPSIFGGFHFHFSIGFGRY